MVIVNHIFRKRQVSFHSHPPSSHNQSVECSENMAQHFKKNMEIFTENGVLLHI